MSTRNEQIKMAADLEAAAQAEDFEHLFEIVLALIARNNPDYAPFLPLGEILLVRVLEGLKTRSERSERLRWYDPRSWF